MKTVDTSSTASLSDSSEAKPIDKLRYLSILRADQDWDWAQPGLSDALAASDNVQGKRRLSSTVKEKEKESLKLAVSTTTASLPSTFEAISIEGSVASGDLSEDDSGYFSGSATTSRSHSATSSTGRPSVETASPPFSDVFFANEFPPSPPPFLSRASMRARQLSYNSRRHQNHSMVELHRPLPISRESFFDQSPPSSRKAEALEGLPAYSCTTLLEGWMSRKMEQTAPGVPAKDRSWHTEWIEIRGTSLKVYSRDSRRRLSDGAEDAPVMVDVGCKDKEGHNHSGEHTGTPPRLFWLLGAKDKALSSFHNKKGAVVAAPSSDSLVRDYSLQHAQSGLAQDYVYRQFIVRVRAEGEQFLLRLDTSRAVVDVIETIQAATAVALDLDDRTIPVCRTLPRRRR